LPHHDGEFDLVVDGEAELAELGGPSGQAFDHVVRRRDHDRLARPDDRARQLDEVPHDLVRKDEPGLLVAVARVIHPGAEDLPRVRQRSKDAADGNRIAVFTRGSGGLEAAVAVADERQRVVVAGGEDGALDLGAAADGASALVLDDPHACSSLRRC